MEYPWTWNYDWTRFLTLETVYDDDDEDDVKLEPPRSGWTVKWRPLGQWDYRRVQVEDRSAYNRALLWNQWNVLPQLKKKPRIKSLIRLFFTTYLVILHRLNFIRKRRAAAWRPLYYLSKLEVFSVIIETFLIIVIGQTNLMTSTTIFVLWAHLCTSTGSNVQIYRFAWASTIIYWNSLTLVKICIQTWVRWRSAALNSNTRGDHHATPFRVYTRLLAESWRIGIARNQFVEVNGCWHFSRWNGTVKQVERKTPV